MSNGWNGGEIWHPHFLSWLVNKIELKDQQVIERPWQISCLFLIRAEKNGLDKNNSFTPPLHPSQYGSRIGSFFCFPSDSSLVRAKLNPITAAISCRLGIDDFRLPPVGAMRACEWLLGMLETPTSCITLNN